MRNTLVIHYGSGETTLERLTQLSNRLGLTPEELAKRFITEGLGNTGLIELTDADFKDIQSLDEVLRKSGLKR